MGGGGAGKWREKVVAPPTFLFLDGLKNERGKKGEEQRGFFCALLKETSD